MSLFQPEDTGIIVETDEQSGGGWELARIRTETEIERQWWQGKHFPDLESGLSAKEKGVLVEVQYGVPGRNYDLARMPEMTFPEAGQVNLLRPEAFLVLEDLMADLKLKFPNIVFPVTALWRTDEAQEKMKEQFGSWALDPGESSHHSGAAFDISLRSYWKIDENGERQSINTWGAKAADFDQTISRTLVDEAERLQVEGTKMNLVVERLKVNGRMVPAVLHVCAGPQSVVQ